MSDETVLTPITPDEGGAAPPKVTPSVMAAAASAPTVKLKPVIRKPLIRKPVIGGAKPVTLKPASGTPPPPAAVPEAAAPATEPAAAPAAPQLKSATSPISAQAALRKTGIVAEGILTPAQAQAAKTKTSRISLESAIGVASATKSAAPMKTIRLRRPTDIPPAPSAIKKPAVSPLKPADPAPAAVDTSAPTVPVAEKPAAPVAEAPVADIPADAEAPTAATVAAVEPSTTVTQKKTLKLRRPNFKRPTVGGLRKPGATVAAPAATEAPAADAPVANMDAVTDIPTIADIPEIRPMPTSAVSSSEDDSKTVSGTPAWLNAMTLVAGIAALIVVGLCTWSLFTQAVGPEAGPNGLASFYSETDRSR